MFANELMRACCCLRRTAKNNFPLNTTENLISLDSGHIGKKIFLANMFLLLSIIIQFLRTRSCTSEKWEAHLWIWGIYPLSEFAAIKELF